jgi:hypothetical protein
MDAMAVGAVLTTIAAGGGEAVAGHAWESLAALVRRPFRRAQPSAGTDAGPAALSTGEAELTALAAAPMDRGCAAALAEALVGRARSDSEFAAALASWWEQARQVPPAGNVSNVVSGGTQYGPVLQGRDFGTLTFGAPAVPPAAPPALDPDA